VREWLQGLAIWWQRRRRFSEEWRFHQQMTRSEFESLGLTPMEARRYAARRVGRRSTHRRAAMRAIGGDARGLIELLPLRSLRRSPALVPCLLAIAALLALACNPYRSQVLASICGALPLSSPVATERLIPLTPAGSVPIGFASVTLQIFGLAGLARIAMRHRHGVPWRQSVYAIGMLLEIASVGMVAWATSLQLLLAWRWGSDGVQGFTLLLFLVAYAWAAWWAWQTWSRDMERRCPVCLRLPGMPEARGKALDVLIEPREVESICLQGHGLAIESRWSNRFESGCSMPLP